MAKSVHVGGGVFRSASDPTCPPAVYIVPKFSVRIKLCQKEKEKKMEQGWVQLNWKSAGSLPTPNPQHGIN